MTTPILLADLNIVPRWPVQRAPRLLSDPRGIFQLTLMKPATTHHVVLVPARSSSHGGQRCFDPRWGGLSTRSHFYKTRQKSLDKLLDLKAVRAILGIPFLDPQRTMLGCVRGEFVERW